MGASQPSHYTPQLMEQTDGDLWKRYKHGSSCERNSPLTTSLMTTCSDFSMSSRQAEWTHAWMHVCTLCTCVLHPSMGNQQAEGTNCIYVLHECTAWVFCMKTHACYPACAADIKVSGHACGNCCGKRGTAQICAAGMLLSVADISLTDVHGIQWLGRDARTCTSR